MKNKDEERYSINVYIEHILTGWVDDQRLLNGFGTVRALEWREGGNNIARMRVCRQCRATRIVICGGAGMRKKVPIPIPIVKVCVECSFGSSCKADNDSRLCTTISRMMDRHK